MDGKSPFDTTEVRFGLFSASWLSFLSTVSVSTNCVLTIQSIYQERTQQGTGSSGEAELRYDPAARLLWWCFGWFWVQHVHHNSPPGYCDGDVSYLFIYTHMFTHCVDICVEGEKTIQHNVAIFCFALLYLCRDTKYWYLTTLQTRLPP